MATGISKKSRKKPASISLEYEGKKTPESILEFDAPDYVKVTDINEADTENILFYGDNLFVLQHLLENGYEGKINLIYIDPPFATEAVFVKRDQTQAYSDELKGGEFVEFLRERLILMHKLLAMDGSIYLHLDGKMAFRMKIIMDEVFGEDNCRAFITRKKCSTKNYTKKTYGNISDYVLFYSKSPTYKWNRPYDPWDYDRMIEQYPYIDELGRRYKKVPIHAPGVRNGETGKMWRGKMPPEGKHWQYTPQRLDELDAAGEIYWSPTGNPRRKVFCDPQKGIPIQDIWLNYRDSINQAQKTTGYPTEKNYEMMKMIVSASSDEGDLVLDCFAGGGTTLGAAFELKRNWIGADNSLESIRAILKRFTEGLDVYGDYVNGSGEPIQTSIDTTMKCGFALWTGPENRKTIEELLRKEKRDKR